MESSKIFRQTGENEAYPKEIITWRKGDEFPEWLSDIARIKSYDHGKKILDLRDTDTGGYEVLDSSGSQALVRVPGKNDFVCRNLHIPGSKLFSLSPRQLKLLYGEGNV